MGATKWNGTTSEYLQPSRGICQGEPTSPYLFALCLDKLSYLISYVVDEGEWKAFKFRRQSHVVSYLIFADDLLLFGEATTNHMKCLINIIYQFYNTFGQQVNHKKTRIFFSRNVNRNVCDDLVQVYGFSETTFLGKYLGVPLTGRAPKKEDYRYIIN